MKQRYVTMLGAFALAATILAAIGIYGVVAYAVAQRTREIGIRMALGATSREIIQSVGRQAVALIATGLVFGLAGSLAVTRLIASQLWGVTPTDPATFAGVTLLLVLVALMACFIPARRAMRVDPTVALRSE
jgi:ABC-type antimicrobial peptide transport system permease subunit